MICRHGGDRKRTVARRYHGQGLVWWYCEVGNAVWCGWIWNHQESRGLDIQPNSSEGKGVTKCWALKGTTCLHPNWDPDAGVMLVALCLRLTFWGLRAQRSYVTDSPVQALESLLQLHVVSLSWA